MSGSTGAGWGRPSFGSQSARIALVGVFVASLVSAQALAVKILALPTPFSIPGVDGAILVPAGVLAYALTFFASDCYAELFGREEAHVVVNVGFVLNFVWLVLLWLAITAPGSPAGADPTAFGEVLGLSTNIVLGSLLAYLVSQNWDVFAFHAIRERTGPGSLWLRNIGSTATSQAIDTVVFVAIAFAIAPALLGIGAALPLPVLVSLVVGQYLVKLLIALVDTPFVYATVGYLRSRGIVRPAEVWSD